MIVMPSWMRILLASGLCFGAGGISLLYMSENTPAWFASLHRPVLFSIPLEIIFFIGVVTFALMAIASSLMWLRDPRPWDFRGWVPLFFTHLLLQIGWLILFFAYNVVFVALVIAFVLATYVLLLTAGAWERSKLAFWLLLPYFMWTLYALGMNIAVWVNN